MMPHHWRPLAHEQNSIFKCKQHTCTLHDQIPFNLHLKCLIRKGCQHIKRENNLRIIPYLEIWWQQIFISKVEIGEYLEHSDICYACWQPTSGLIQAETHKHTNTIFCCIVSYYHCVVTVFWSSGIKNCMLLWLKRNSSSAHNQGASYMQLQ